MKQRPVTYFAGTGRAAPQKVVTNNDFAALGLETSHEWIVERTGINERRIAGPGESTCSLAADAARQAMQRAHITASVRAIRSTSLFLKISRCNI